jgi:hypothetical protein
MKVIEMTIHSPQEHNNVVVRDGALVCPRCGKTNLRLYNVVVYHREGNDPPIMTETHVRRGYMPFSLEFDWGSCPSQRRDGMIIVLDCENCGGGFDFAIMQDKGQIILDWHDLPTADEATYIAEMRRRRTVDDRNDLCGRIISVDLAVDAAAKHLSDIMSVLRKLPFDAETRYLLDQVAEIGMRKSVHGHTRGHQGKRQKRCP